MSEKRSRHLFWLTMVAALVLQLLELPGWLAAIRPPFVPMAVAYWALTTGPQPTGVLGAWLAGLMLDVLLGTVLGQHALGLVIIVFMVRQSRNFLVLFPVWQAGAILTPLWLLYTFLMFWIDGVTGHQADPWMRWLPVISAALLWPAVAGAIAALRRRAQEDSARL